MTTLAPAIDPVADTEPPVVGSPAKVIHRIESIRSSASATDRCELLADYNASLRRLRLVTSNLSNTFDDGSPIHTAEKIRALVNEANQHLTAIAMNAEFVGAEQ